MRSTPIRVALLISLFAACSSGLDRETVSADAVLGEDGVQRVKVNMHSYYFEPNRIVVHSGKPVELTVGNSSFFVPHNLTLLGDSMTVDVSKWGPGTHKVTFTPKKTGEFKFFCHKDGHEKKGMVGTLVVIP